MTSNSLGELQVRNTIQRYIDGINASGGEVLAGLFTQDGVLMAPDAPTIVGAELLKNFFNQGFETLKLDAKIEFDEVVITDTYAYARTNSRANVTVLQTNSAQMQRNREFFLLVKEGDEWKISRYMFNKMPNT